VGIVSKRWLTFKFKYCKTPKMLIVLKIFLIEEQMEKEIKEIELRK